MVAGVAIGGIVGLAEGWIAAVAGLGGSDDIDLSKVERELARPGLRLRFAASALERLFRDRQREEARPQNRVTIPLLVLLFDAFILSEVRVSPEVLSLSFWLRFAVLTPMCLVFVVIDRRLATNRWSHTATAVLLVLPTLLAVIEVMHTTSPGALSNWQAVPLMQLALLTSRLDLPRTVCASIAMDALYAGTAVSDPLVPDAQLPAVLLTTLAISIAVLVFAVRLETRDRQVFLLNLQADFKNALLSRQNRSLARLTQVDPLTGLGNRRCFDERLMALWGDERSRRTDVALIMFDIDCFKLFNDSFGHQAGDECLASLGRAAAGCLRGDQDTVVRYGGEEFAIILPHATLSEGWAVAERVRVAVLDLSVPHCTAPSAVVTVSLGVARARPADQSITGLINAADRCLYAAKRNGRNRVVTQDMMEAVDVAPSRAAQDSVGHSSGSSGERFALGAG